MLKRIILVLIVFSFLTGCTLQKYDLEELSIEESVNLVIASNTELYNVNNVGYRYYLPRGFILKEDRDNIQILKSNGVEYFLNVDLVSYYNKTSISKNTTDELYKDIIFESDGKTGFLEIVQNNDYFLIKMVYNYAIIEVQTKEEDIKSSVIDMAYIVSSIKYNDNVINNKFGEDVLELNETTYKIFGPERETETKSYAYYLEQYDTYTGEIETQIQDPDIIGN